MLPAEILYTGPTDETPFVRSQDRQMDSRWTRQYFPRFESGSIEYFSPILDNEQNWARDLKNRSRAQFLKGYTHW